MYAGAYWWRIWDCPETNDHGRRKRLLDKELLLYEDSLHEVP